MNKINITQKGQIIRGEYENGSYLEMKAGLFLLKYVHSSGLTDEETWDLEEILFDYLEKQRFNQKFFGIRVKKIYATIWLAAALVSLTYSIILFDGVFKSIESSKPLNSNAIENLEMTQKTSSLEEIRGYLSKAVAEIKVNSDNKSLESYRQELNYLLQFLNKESEMSPERLEAVRNLIQKYSELEPNTLNFAEKRLSWQLNFISCISFVCFVGFWVSLDELREKK